MFNVYQPWDPLKVCVVGHSYDPEFYRFIKNKKARFAMEKIARETEEDYQKLISLLEEFGVEVLRPNIIDNYTDALVLDKIIKPPMNPRDYSIMIGKNFYLSCNYYDSLKGADWPDLRPTTISNLENLPENIKKEIISTINVEHLHLPNTYSDIQSKIPNIIFNQLDKGVQVNGAMITRIGKDLYFGTENHGGDLTLTSLKKIYSKMFPDYRCHVINTGGHSDGCFCPVVPGLIVSLNNIQTYEDTFPGWEVVYLPNQSWNKVKPFMDLKKKNKGKWWVPGEELNDDFTSFVEEWLGHWVGYVEETVFDVNMLVIDEKNVVCNNYHEEVFKAFDRHGIKPHVVNFRHRYFWDGGLHCITSDVHREGVMKDYFPERG